jgi:hypothetical protein
MARSVCLLAMHGLIWAPSAGRGQETYPIKLKEEARGHRHKVDKRITAKSTMKVDSQGHPLQATLGNPAHVLDLPRFGVASRAVTVIDRPHDRSRSLCRPIQ